MNSLLAWLMLIMLGLCLLVASLNSPKCHEQYMRQYSNGTITYVHVCR